MINDELRLRELTGVTEQTLQDPARGWPVRTIRAFSVAGAQAEGVTFGYLPGLAMRRIADLNPGPGEPNAWDAVIIAEAAPDRASHTASIQFADEQLADLTMLCGLDEDLTSSSTRHRTESDAC